jgi:DNA-directed RNA polymerase, mitochondrial
VIQVYLRNERRRIRTEVGRLDRFKCFNLTLKIPTEELAHKKAENGIVANFVHSYDATHMMLTTLAARSQGITGLRMIHDSFATHADQAGILARILRDEFARMYESHDPLEAFHAACVAQMGHAANLLPSPPPKSTLDVNLVRNSEYFFS